MTQKELLIDFLEYVHDFGLDRYGEFNLTRTEDNDLGMKSYDQFVQMFLDQCEYVPKLRQSNYRTYYVEVDREFPADRHSFNFGWEGEFEPPREYVLELIRNEEIRFDEKFHRFIYYQVG